MAISLQCFLLLLFTLRLLTLSLCTPFLTRCPPDESHALLLFKHNLNDSRGYLDSWVNGTDCCEWAGIDCDDHTNHVAVVNFNPFQIDGWKIDGGVICDSLCRLRFLTTLFLYDQRLTGTLPSCLENLLYLQYLELRHNQLSGNILSSLGNLSSLTRLDLSNNQLSGSIPSSLGNLSSLTYLDLSRNQLSGNIPSSLGMLSSLLLLDISANQLSGPLPCSFSRLSSLAYLNANGILLNENTCSTLPSSLEILHLSLDHHHSNSISESLFHNLTRLTSLSLSNCVLNISLTWFPPFQLFELSLKSCNIDHQFPLWISTQFSLGKLSLANCSLMGEIPSWVWEISLLIDLSDNLLTGSISPRVSSLSQHLPNIKFSETSSLSQLRVLDLANNKFSGTIPRVSSLSQLQVLNLANNKFSGTIPPSLAECSKLQILNLGNNCLEGRIPYEFGKLSNLLALFIPNNKINGPFPHSITNCRSLQVLDIGHNLFEGYIPKSIELLSNIRVLMMKRNYFRGSIPSNISQLQYLQILDLSSNQFSGSIPDNFSHLPAMTIESEYGFKLFYDTDVSFYDVGVNMTIKGMEVHYSYVFSALIAIDLSHNQLNGHIPSDFGKLKGLKFLNLSSNNLSGAIPNSLGELSELESLDLSTNMLSEKIPQAFVSLDYLGFLNLSNNNLSGIIPQGEHMVTFGEASFLNNPKLWGCPLPKNCSQPHFAPPPLNSTFKEEKRLEVPWYEITLGLACGLGFGVVVAMLIQVRIEWRIKYFKGVDIILKFLFPPLRKWTL